MVEHFILEYAKKIALHPEQIRVQTQECEEGIQITLFSSQEDMGKFIGKNGKMIHSLKNVLSGCKVKNGQSYKIVVQSV
ncbi:KH domain-containing protein [uncultured Helicobacter sp.]|mgnify:CR=1 FL=1|uniref:KH domain-containing protein n=1 Tax=uncultured Helicobacter sp. TaxID=175537 RepID=UPI001FA178E8|nr:KH domain-containing protein [uncultured Helicobacter sp.]HIY44191.1 KH domain-containing protein [Candidatus Helicobacter avistercoris]